MYYEELQPIIELAKGRQDSKVNERDLMERFYRLCRQGIFDQDLQRGCTLQKAAEEMKKRYDEARVAVNNIRRRAMELYGHKETSL
jgi:hypothetical protein